jgi:hypothetical protein
LPVHQCTPPWWEQVPLRCWLKLYVPSAQTADAPAAAAAASGSEDLDAAFAPRPETGAAATGVGTRVGTGVGRTGVGTGVGATVGGGGVGVGDGATGVATTNAGVGEPAIVGLGVVATCAVGCPVLDGVPPPTAPINVRAPVPYAVAATICFQRCPERNPGTRLIHGEGMCAVPS